MGATAAVEIADYFMIRAARARDWLSSFRPQGWILLLTVLNLSTDRQPTVAYEI